MPDRIPKICSECDSLHLFEYSVDGCGSEPADCALAKARYVRSCNAQAKREGRPVESVMARREMESEMEIIQQMADEAAFMTGEMQ